MTTVTIHLDSKTKELIDEFAQDHSISRSSTIKLLINDYFIKNEEGDSNDNSVA